MAYKYIQCGALNTIICMLGTKSVEYRIGACHLTNVVAAPKFMVGPGSLPGSNLLDMMLMLPSYCVFFLLSYSGLSVVKMVVTHNGSKNKNRNLTRW